MPPNGETEQALLKKLTEKKPVTPERYQASFSLKNAPSINLEKDRIQSILNNKPAKFEIIDNEKLKNPTIGERIIQDKIQNSQLGNVYIKKHTDTIEQLAKKHDVDPDLVKAVMWTENARGHKFGLNALVDYIGISGSQAPMNINGKIWGGLINKKGSRLDDEKDNIEAGVILLKRIQDRIEKPTPAKIGSIWNFTGRENTNEVGQEIENAYKTKPWKTKN